MTLVPAEQASSSGALGSMQTPGGPAQPHSGKGHFSLQPVGGTSRSAPAGTSSDGGCCGTGGLHLLSIFPLRDSASYARLTCIAVSEPATPCREPFCTTRGQLLTLLLQVLPGERARAVLADVDNKVVVQLSISDADARSIGFLAKVM